MARYLNVAIMQMPVTDNKNLNLKEMKKQVAALMHNYIRPELIIGVEFGISGFEADVIPGATTDFLAEIAREHHIYFIPGTMMEKDSMLPEGKYYNTCPVFGPKGQLLAAYRKKAPFVPGETSYPSTDPNYFVFKIEEKDITVGLMICYEQYFPEVSRTLALMGAEILICPAAELVEYKRVPDVISRARALENEAYFIFTSGTGTLPTGLTLQGRSTIVNPEGDIIWQGGSSPCIVTKTLNIDDVTYKRNFGSDQHLKALREFSITSPFAENVAKAPVYITLGDLPMTHEQYIRQAAQQGLGTIGKQI